MKRIKHAISVARKVMEHTKHTFLVGEQATKFALQMGFEEMDLHTNYSLELHQNWTTDDCQPNFWKVRFRHSSVNLLIILICFRMLIRILKHLADPTLQ